MVAAAFSCASLRWATRLILKERPGLDDVRIHDLGYFLASRAFGESLTMIS